MRQDATSKIARPGGAESPRLPAAGDRRRGVGILSSSSAAARRQIIRHVADTVSQLDPQFGLRFVTWNCGGLSTQTHAIRALVIAGSPSILFLQEARNTGVGSYSALRAECNLLG